MGVVEEVFARISWKSLLLVAFAYLIINILRKRFNEERRLRNTGGVRAPEYSGKLPLNIDLIIDKIKASANHTNHLLWENMFARLNNHTVEVNIIGKRIIFTDDPENIQAILAKQFRDYGKGEPFRREFEPFLGDSIFTTDGAEWHASRQLIRPQFIKDRVSDLHTFEGHLQTLFTVMSVGGDAAAAGAVIAAREQGSTAKYSASGLVIDMNDLLFRYTLDVATDFLLGQDTKSLTIPQQGFAEAFAEVQRVQSQINRAGPAKRFVPRDSYNNGLRVINEFINPFIEHALEISPEELEQTISDNNEGGTGRYTFLHALAQFTRDRKVLRDQLVAVLLAGRDTTASTLSFAIYELSKKPKCVQRLRDEIAQHVGLESDATCRNPSYADLKDMKYLKYVLNETLRMYPAIPYNVRMAFHDTTLPRGGGPDGNQPVAIAKNTPIAYSTLTMQRRADLYPPDHPHPNIFSPERWEGWQPKSWQFVPFNGGPRICIGQQFALTEMGYVLVRLFQKFERVVSHMDPIDHGIPTLKDSIVLMPGDGVKVSFYEPGNVSLS
ncbi:cytochrome p450 protein [Penicillium angulare]|uniref:cytochrome p450 protein n=1 Tax=Penicillium angulare TaxID=116970 RepID=UPI0025418785|nr:cytochrome p450 protein [Penicillium angulare]KAJ5287128.1 cytochrome p450 protein [Penicillium angulare]